jgi:hypothetical protein
LYSCYNLQISLGKLPPWLNLCSIRTSETWGGLRWLRSPSNVCPQTPQLEQLFMQSTTFTRAQEIRWKVIGSPLSITKWKDLLKKTGREGIAYVTPPLTLGIVTWNELPPVLRRKQSSRHYITWFQNVP